MEGQIRANEFDAAQAAQRLRDLGRPPPDDRPLAEVLLPGGRPIGFRDRGARDDTRTVTPSEFQTLLEALSPGAQAVLSPAGYGGLWFRRSDGSIFGIRRSQKHGITVDVIQNNHPILGNGYKVHQNE